MNERTCSTMGSVISFADELREKSLEDLFEETRRYGHITLFENNRDRTFYFCIEFESVPGTTMKAKSEFGHETIASAIVEAVDRAKQMVAQFK